MALIVPGGAHATLPGYDDIEIIESPVAELLNTELEKIVAEAIETSLRKIPTSLANIDATIATEFTARHVVERLRPLLHTTIDPAVLDAVERRVRVALDGELQPEIEALLDRHRELIDRPLAGIRDRLPGHQLQRLQTKLLGLTILTLPNAVYGPMLAATASGHFAQAFCGPACFNPYQFQRGVEVTKVLIWQLKHREGIALSLRQVTLLWGDLEQALPIPPLETWGAFGRDVATFATQIEGIEAQIQRIDRVTRQGWERGAAELTRLTDTLRTQLTTLQSRITDPIHRVVETIDTRLADVATPIREAIPRDLQKIPTTWKEIKKRSGLHGRLIGSWGERIPLRYASLTNPFDPVLLHNGEFYHQVVDLEIPTRGEPLAFVRTYRSRHAVPGPFGHHWTHTFHERLFALPGGDVVWWRGDGRTFRFVRRMSGAWASPRGVYSRLSIAPSGKWTLDHADGGATVFAHDGRLQSRRDRFGNAITCHYRDDALVAVSDPVGRRIQLFYDRHGRVVRLRDWGAREWHYAYSDAGDLVAATHAEATTRYLYERETHRLVAIVDPNGARYLENTYGTHGLAAGRVIAQRYGSAGERMTARYVLTRPAWWSRANQAIDRVVVTDRRGAMREYRHNRTGELLTMTRIDAYGRRHPQIAHRYDGEGRRVRTILADGREWRVKYAPGTDARERGNVSHLTVRGVQGGQRVWQFAHRPRRNHLLRMANPLQQTITWDYDGDGVSQITMADGAVHHFTRNAFGQTMRYRDPVQVETVMTYAPAGYPRAITRDAAGTPRTIVFRYDTLGRQTAIRDADGHETRREYNAHDRIVREDPPDNLPWHRTLDYDANGNLTDRREIVGGATQLHHQLQYNDTDHLVALHEADAEGDAAMTRYDYTPTDRLQRITWPEGNATQFRYDRWDLLRSATHGAGTSAARTWTLGRDRAGRVTRWTGDAGSRVDYRYDEFGDLAEMHESPGLRHVVMRNGVGAPMRERWFRAPRQPLREWVYRRDPLGRTTALHVRDYARDRDAAWETEWYRRNRRGQLVDIRDRGGHRWQLQYDALGHVQQLINPLGDVTQWTHDTQGHRRAEMRRATQSRWEWHYDPLGRLTRAIDPIGATTTYRYAQHPWPVARTDPNGRMTRWHYDARGRLATYAGKGRVALTWDGNDRLQSLDAPDQTETQYRYDAAGQLREPTPVATQSRPQPPVATEVQYARDPLGRVTTLTTPAGAVSLTHDAWRGINTITYPHGGRVERTFTVRGEVASERYRYDGQTLWGWTYHYDPAGNLVSHTHVDDGQMDTFTYDRHDQLILPSSAGAAQVFPLPTRPSHGSQSLLFGDVAGTLLGRIAFHEDRWELHPIISDRLGSTRLFLDTTGEITHRLDFSPFGRPLQPPPPHARFAGHLLQADGLIDMGARRYDPQRRRFLSPDPLGHQVALRWDAVRAGTGPAHVPKIPVEPDPNLYWYAENNPLRFVDPDGRQITMTRQGSHLTIDVTLEYGGAAVTSGFTDALRRGFALWAGAFPNHRAPGQPPWQVTLRADIQRRGTMRDSSRHQIDVVAQIPGTRADVNYRGGMEMRVGSDAIVGELPDVVARLVAHEFGHWFGLPDRYYKVGRNAGLPLPRFEENLMACTGPDCVVNGSGTDDIWQIYQYFQSGRLNRQWSPRPTYDRMRKKG
jgi:RHS repeat-associated protein